jgi:hypothetical protein
MAQDASAMGGKGTDILGNGIIESSGDAFKFPALTSTNYDSITVGNDFALATAPYAPVPFRWDPAKAENNLEVKKNQQVGPCESCCKGDNSCSECQDACSLVNIDQVKIGSRTAYAFGNAEAVNNVKLVLNQAR